MLRTPHHKLTFAILSLLTLLPALAFGQTDPVRTPGQPGTTRPFDDTAIRRDAAQRELQSFLRQKAQADKEAQARFRDEVAAAQRDAVAAIEAGKLTILQTIFMSYGEDERIRKGPAVEALSRASVYAPAKPIGPSPENGDPAAAVQPQETAQRRSLSLETVADYEAYFPVLKQGARSTETIMETVQPVFKAVEDARAAAKADAAARAKVEADFLAGFKLPSLLSAAKVTTADFTNVLEGFKEGWKSGSSEWVFDELGSRTIGNGLASVANRTVLPDVSGPSSDVGLVDHDRNRPGIQNVAGETEGPRLVRLPSSEAAKVATEVARDASALADKGLQEVAKAKKAMAERIAAAQQNLDDALAANAAGQPSGEAEQDPNANQQQAGGGGGGAGGGEGGGSGGGGGNASNIAMPGGLSPFNTDNLRPGTDGSLGDIFPSQYAVNSNSKGASNSGISPEKYKTLPLAEIPRFAYQSGLGTQGGVKGPVSDFFNSSASAGSGIQGGAGGPTGPNADGAGTPGGAAGMSGGAKGAENLSGGVFDGVNPGYEPGDPPLNAEKSVGFGEGSSGTGNEGGDLIGLAKKDGDGAAVAGAASFALQLLANAPKNPQDPRQAKHILFYMGYLRREPCRDQRAAGIGICVNAKPKAKPADTIQSLATNSEPQKLASRVPASAKTTIPIVDRARAAARGRRR